ncbi:hypothetical protein ACFLUU_10785 [Chloroflexota bacterium]
MATAVLARLDLTPLAEELLMQLEVDYSHTSLEAEQRKKAIAGLERKLENLSN